MKKVLPLLIGATAMTWFAGMFSVGALVFMWVICIVIAVASSSAKESGED